MIDIKRITGPIVSGATLVGSVVSIIIFWNMFTDKIDAIDKKHVELNDKLEEALVTRMDAADSNVINIIGSDVITRSVNSYGYMIELLDARKSALQNRRSLVASASIENKQSLEMLSIDTEIRTLEQIRGKVYELWKKSQQ